MKKFYSLLLAFIMVFGMLHFCAFANETDADSAETIEFPNAQNKIQLLYELGIFDIEYEAEDSVARSDFAATLVRLLKAEDMLASCKGTSYTDVAADDYASKEINLMNIMNIMTGKTATEFYPNDDITYFEATAALVRLLGYDVKADAKGGWSAGFNMTAHDLGLTKGVPSELTVDYAGAGAIAIMIFNALDIPMVDAYISPDGEYVASNDKKSTLMKDYWEIVKEKGTVTAVGNTNLFGVNDPLTIDEIEINTVDYIITNYDFKNYLGMEVNYYYINDETAIKKTVLFMEPSVNAKKVRLTTNNPALINGNVITYTERSTDKKTNYKISGNAIILSNGYSVPSLAGNWPENGYIDLISNDGSNYDVVIMYDFDTYVVKSAAEDRITLYYNATHPTTGKACIDITNDTIISVIKNGEYVEVTDIRPGEVISVAYHAKAGYFILVSDKTDEFTVESVIANPFRVTDGENEYIVNKDFLTLIDNKVEGTQEIEPGINYSFKFDFLGNIYGMGEFKSDMLYGVMEGVLSEGVFSTSVRVKMFSQLGHEEYTLSPKIEFNGVSKKAEDIYSDIESWFSKTGPSNLAVCKFKLVSKTEIGALTIATIDGHQYDKISDSVIVRTRCAVPGKSTTYSVYQDSEGWVTGYLWPDVGNLYPDTSLKAMYIPVEPVTTSSGTEYILGDETKWKYDSHYNVFPKTNNKLDPITFYDCDKFQRIGFAVRMEVSAGATVNLQTAGIFLVDSVSMAVDGDENPVYKVSCWRDGTKYSYLTASTDDVMSVAKTLEKGDVITLNTGLSSEITAIVKIFSYNTANADETTLNNVHSMVKKTNATSTFVVMAKYDDFLKTSSDIYLKMKFNKVSGANTGLKSTATTVTVFDGNTITKGDYGSLVAGDVIIVKHHHKVHQMIVFRNFPENYEFLVGGEGEAQIYLNYN